ncbi:hypothetical protein CR513_38453, partial [Mucuna pruriens]
MKKKGEQYAKSVKQRQEGKVHLRNERFLTLRKSKLPLYGMDYSQYYARSMIMLISYTCPKNIGLVLLSMFLTYLLLFQNLGTNSFQQGESDVNPRRQEEEGYYA